MIFALKLATILALAVILFILTRSLSRDFRNKVIHSHVGTFRRADRPLAFWFWTSNYFGLAIVVAVAIIGSLFVLVS